MKHTLATIMKEKAYFEYFQLGKLHYVIHVATLHTLTSYRFTIDTTGEDIKEGRFNHVEKGIMLMRWFNKCVEDKSLKIEVLESDPGASTSGTTVL